MRLADRIDATHFKESVTGETLFFYGSSPWPSTWTGYIITSDDDVARLKSRLKTYQWVVSYVIVPFGSALVLFWLRSGSMPGLQGSELLQQILRGVVAGLAVAAISTFVFRRFVLEPIIHKYPLSQEKISYREIQGKIAVARSRRAWVGHGLLVLFVSAGGTVLLLLGKDPEDRIKGVLIIVFAGALAAWVLYSLRLKRQRTDRDRWMVG